MTDRTRSARSAAALVICAALVLGCAGPGVSPTPAAPTPVLPPPATLPPAATPPRSPAPAAPEQPLPAPSDAALSPALQAALDDWLAQADVPGAVVGVRLADGRTAVVAAGRTDDVGGESIQPGHRFRIGSITKTMVATLVLRLVDQGVIDLDAPLETYVPDAAFGRVTLRQLLSHSGGVPDFGREPTYAQLLFIQPGRVWTADEVVGLVADQGLDFEPGTRTSYSNTGYVLAGMAAEAATGRPLAQLLREQVLEPAGLSATYLEEMEDSPAMAVNGHFDVDGDGSPDNVSGVPYTALVTSGAAAGGVSASALDVLEFSTWLFEGGLLSDDALGEMTTFQPGTAGHGLGLIRASRDGHEVWGHDGALPGFSAAFGYLPEEQVSVVAMANQTGANVNSLLQRVLSQSVGGD